MSVLRRTQWAGLIATLALSGAACKPPGAKTPELAYERLATAVAERDAGKLFDTLDLETQWSWMSIQRAHREAHDIVLSNFPVGPERDRALLRFAPGATSENARALFIEQLTADVWGTLAAELITGRGGALTRVDENNAEMVSRDGRRLAFRQRPADRAFWGFAGLADDAEKRKLRALADLESVRTSATAYERAATRAGR